MPETKLEYIITHYFKADTKAHLKSHPEDFEELLRLSLIDKQPYSWRASWILCGYIKKNDPLLQPHINTLVDMLPKVKDNQKREFLMMLRKMDLPEDLEGVVFDHCVNIWEDVSKQASVRLNALKLIMKIIDNHPDLKNEISFLVQSQYTDNLTETVKNSILKITRGTS